MVLYQRTHHFGAVTGFTAILFMLSMAVYQTIHKTGKHRSIARAQM
ncbi:putative efflux transporter [Bacillus spizizenii str. W23]|uniref:Putative efflux transporter n=1 Tax=Bacillus spizizenii (strain ATCC 23059 / NRRL B-14472 / W23) TaxID=655816 RepID=E0U1L2_BACSH|nr:putative efflux transporter [Bacillus spizizenii str. W23]EFG90822.1 putative efflux transporter [Bacillus spizizenii ATCC 6633 = JCM 2499]MBE0174588.1 transporter [Bacillus spizizenii]QCJ19388.1 transporter [Bacillus subtilis]MDR4203800.1 transporter [Bacillus spizizenii ATCC 6633 = JCM 2499]